jgi:uncharacterized protein (TIGR00725 family)
VVQYVAVVGPGEGATAANIADARVAGRWLAEQGHVLVCGGLGGPMGGVMAGAAAGAAAGAGTSVGLLPGFDRAAASSDLTVSVPTGLGEMRNALVVRAADVVLAIGGSWGTLSEMALAVRTGVPVVSYAGWEPPAAGVEVAGSLAEALARVAELLTRQTA